MITYQCSYVKQNVYSLLLLANNQCIQIMNTGSADLPEVGISCLLNKCSEVMSVSPTTIGALLLHYTTTTICFRNLVEFLLVFTSYRIHFCSDPNELSNRTSFAVFMFPFTKSAIPTHIRHYQNSLLLLYRT